MRVSEQIDAMEVMGVNSAGYLILPKILSAVVMLPALEKVPAAGSNSSAVASAPPLPSDPPATKTFPLVSKVAVCPERIVPMSPVELNVPLAGSYNSALAVLPPAMSTLSFCSRVAVCALRAVPIVPVAAKEPVAGSYNSALERQVPVESHPPATSTLPLASNVAV